MLDRPSRISTHSLWTLGAMCNITLQDRGSLMVGHRLLKELGTRWFWSLAGNLVLGPRLIKLQDRGSLMGFKLRKELGTEALTPRGDRIDVGLHKGRRNQGV